MSLIPAPALVLPGSPAAPPTPAPAPADALIPPPPGSLLPSSGPGEPLPPLSLPPEVPPKGKTESISRSSPITGAQAVRVERFPVAHAEGVAKGFCLITYYNHTGQDLNLTIEGQAVKLPSKMYVEAKVARTFTWGRKDSPASEEKVGEGYVGIDIVFRE
jgi:hypothetical protein